jgi:uncharacterized phage-associated protein
MHTPFDQAKAAQAAGVFLHLAGGRLHYMVLIKLLYLADRESLLRSGSPITHDTYYTMKTGPVLNSVHDLLTHALPGEVSAWSKSISRPTIYEVALWSDPGTDLLSGKEEEIIRNVFKRYRIYIRRPVDFVKLLHQILPEIVRVEDGRVPLEIASILQAQLKAGTSGPTLTEGTDSKTA